MAAPDEASTIPLNASRRETPKPQIQQQPTINNMELKLQLLEIKVSHLSKQIDHSVREERRLLEKLKSSKSVYQAMRDCGYLHSKSGGAHEPDGSMEAKPKETLNETAPTCTTTSPTATPPSFSSAADTKESASPHLAANESQAPTSNHPQIHNDGPPAVVIIEKPFDITSPLDSSVVPKAPVVTRTNLSVPSLICIERDSSSSWNVRDRRERGHNKENNGSISLPGATSRKGVTLGGYLRQQDRRHRAKNAGLHEATTSHHTLEDEISSSFAAVKFQHRLRQFQSAEAAARTNPNPPFYKLPAPKSLHPLRQKQQNNTNILTDGEAKMTTSVTMPENGDFRFVLRETPSKETNTAGSQKFEESSSVSGGDELERSSSPDHESARAKSNETDDDIKIENHHLCALTPERKTELRTLVLVQISKIQTLLERHSSRKQQANDATSTKARSEQEDSLGSI